MKVPARNVETLALFRTCTISVVKTTD